MATAIIGRRRRVGGHVVLAGAEQHLDAVAHRVVDVVLDPLEPGPHVEQILQRDRLFGSALPTGDGGWLIEFEHTIADQDADGRMGDALGHAPRDQRGVGINRSAGAENRIGLYAVTLREPPPRGAGRTRARLTPCGASEANSSSATR